MTALAASFLEAVSPQQWLLIAAFVLIGFVFLWGRAARRPRDGSPKQYQREIDAAAGRSEAVKRDMEQLLVELETLAKNINSQLDSNFGKLQQLIADADRRIAAMRILIAECKRLAGEVPSGELSGSGLESADSRVGVSQSAAEPGGEPLTSGAAEAKGRRPDSPNFAEPVGDPDARRRRIYELADRGLSPVQIAQELREQPGEVELILNLRKSGLQQK